MAASSVDQDFEFARGYVESMPEIAGALVRAVSLNADAKRYPDELNRVALALAEVDAALRSLNQSISEAKIAKRLKQKDHG